MVSQKCVLFVGPRHVMLCLKLRVPPPYPRISSIVLDYKVAEVLGNRTDNGNVED